MSRRLALAAAGVVVAAAAAAWWLWPAPAAPTGPNLLVIVWDTTRADRLGPYGYARDTTPWLNRFAAEGVVFERAVSPETWTPPTHASLFTGFAPKRHGVKATYKWLDGHHVTLAEHLGAHGYDSFVFSANPYIAPDTNLTQGFGTFTSSFTKPWKKDAKSATLGKLIPRDRSTDISPGWKGKKSIGEVHPYKDAAPVAHQALAGWLETQRASGRPWFAFVNLMEAHIPRVPSMASRKALLTDEQIELGLATQVSQMDLFAYTFGKADYSPAELDAINGVYDAAVRDLDLATGAMIDDLRARGLLDDTVVVLTADHGENLGDHHLFGHKFSVWDTLTRVPLVVWWPEKLAPRRVPTAVSNLALFSTILDLLGVPAPETAPDLASSVLDAARPEPVFSTLFESTPVSIQRVDAEWGLDDKARWLRTFDSAELDGWKLIHGCDGSDALYHLPTDPGELTDRATEEPARVGQLRSAIEAWLAKVPAYDPSRRAASDVPEDLKRSEKAMMAALGYVEDDDAGTAGQDPCAPAAPPTP